MKTSTLILISLSVSTVLAANTATQLKTSELSWVDEQVAAIKPPRKGARDYYLNSIRNPFVFLNKGNVKKKGSSKPTASKTKKSTSKTTTTTVVKKKPKLTLEAIINKAALIDGKWYREGQKVYSYKLERVDGKQVILTRDKKRVVLSTKTKRRSLKFNNN
ncbi:MAG: hypothetical protein ABXS93_00525 [Sulfurimonas sp.]